MEGMLSLVDLVKVIDFVFEGSRLRRWRQAAFQVMN